MGLVSYVGPQLPPGYWEEAKPDLSVEFSKGNSASEVGEFLDR
jgi:hypothetical protein